jgi:superfamily II RNA helicase
LEAIAALERGDVLVTAPTGSGKTWIARQAIEQLLSKGGRSWYASPLKALSNSIFAEFGSYFGDENVGILTGDRKENPRAPVIVGTTEILRNQLYDAMSTGKDLEVDLVVLDEAHYLGDEDRGVVWEEVMIYLPSRVRLLLLSATVSNTNEIAKWLEWLRQVPCLTIETHERPVPLHPLFMFPTGEVTPLIRRRALAGNIRHFLQSKPRAGFTPRKGVANFSKIISALRHLDLLPAIFFLKSRADCNLALISALPRLDPKESNEVRRRFHLRLRQLLQRNPYLKRHRQLSALRQGRVAAHHGGQLPQWKAMIENLMKKGDLEAIFSTSTVAAGVNFPARTVVLSQSDRFNGREFVPLSATDLLQMTGRAGRRGMDEVGFVTILPGPYQDIPLIFDLLHSSPEPIDSQIQLTFSMVLNLLLSHRPEEIRGLLSRSFATFQDLERKDAITDRLWHEFQQYYLFLQEEGYVDTVGRLSMDGIWASQLRLDQPLLIAECIRREVFPENDPAMLAGLTAPFVGDQDNPRALLERVNSRNLALGETFTKMASALQPLLSRLRQKGFPVHSLPFWPAAAIYLWVSGAKWEEVLEMSGLDEGDLAMLIYRTADSLRQLEGLWSSHPELAASAIRAVQALLREPVLVPT